MQKSVGKVFNQTGTGSTYPKIDTWFGGNWGFRPLNAGKSRSEIRNSKLEGKRDRIVSGKISRWGGGFEIDDLQLAVEEGLRRTVCDYIAGMTDRYCLKMLAPLE